MFKGFEISKTKSSTTTRTLYKRRVKITKLIHNHKKSWANKLGFLFLDIEDTDGFIKIIDSYVALDSGENLKIFDRSEYKFVKNYDKKRNQIRNR